MNPFMGAGALGQAVDELNGDNFDHGPEGFIGGGYIALRTTGGRPILQQHAVPEGTPKWGPAWKKAMRENYLKSASVATHGSVMSYRDSYLDLDPTYRDVYGNPLLRLTFDFHDNELARSKFLTDKAALIGKVDHDMMTRGEALYIDNCAGCHMDNGEGLASGFPPLAKSAPVQASAPATVLQAIIGGATVVATESKPTALAMPAFGWKPSDEEIADLATYIRNAWGTRAPVISASDVATIRNDITRKTAVK